MMRDDGQQPDIKPDAVDPSSPQTPEPGSGREPVEHAAAPAPEAPDLTSVDEGVPAEASLEPSPVTESEEPIPPIAMPEGDPEPITSVMILEDIPASAAASGDAPAVPDPAGSGTTAIAEVDSGELEEITMPSTVTTLDPLAEGMTVGPNDEVMIEGLDQVRGRVNRYRATLISADGTAVVELLEAPQDHAGLSRMAEVLEQVRYAMLPTLHLTWVADGRRYVVVNRGDGRTLSDALNSRMSPDEVISTVLQLAQVLRRLHSAGWALVGLSPDNVRLGQPLQVTQLGAAMRIGEATTASQHVAGYSAPELVGTTTITGKEDVYTLGAILYRGLTGEPIPEEGPELSNLSATLRTPSAPQVLAPALAPVEERVDLEAFYQSLLAFKRRLAARPIALRVASGTSIGLNQTRSTNEDACGYLTWSTAWEGRVAYNALLCMIDGMGGMEAGEVAATSALRAVLRRAGEYAASRIADAPGADLQPGSSTQAEADEPLNLEDLVQAAAEASFTAAEGRQVGATITCVSIEDGRLRLGHVGDTRAYLLRDGELSRLSRDHSLVAAMVASGVITAEEAVHHPESNKVLRSLGGMRRLPPGYIDDLSVAYGQSTLDLRDGDRLLLCSDGIWGSVNDATLKILLIEAIDCETVVHRAIELALEAGAPDNAAIIVAHCSVMPAS